MKVRPLTIAVVLATTAAVLVIAIGGALWTYGQGIAVQPATYSTTSTFRYTPAQSAGPDPAYSIRFNITLVTDQPWIESGFKPFNGSLEAVPGSAVKEINIGTIAFLLCKTACSSSNFLQIDIESVRSVTPTSWALWEPYFLYSLKDGSPLYITYDLAFTVFYVDGSHGGGGWESGARLAPIVAIPDYAAMGRSITIGLGSLFVAATGILAFARWTERRWARAGPA